jgi:transcriptional regulator with XRE-family HTH domain
MTPLKLAILAARIRQYEVAQRAQITETRLSRLATGRALPTDAERKRLAEVVGVPEARLFGEAPSPAIVAAP